MVVGLAALNQLSLVRAADQMVKALLTGAFSKLEARFEPRPKRILVHASDANSNTFNMPTLYH